MAKTVLITLQAQDKATKNIKKIENSVNTLGQKATK